MQVVLIDDHALFRDGLKGLLERRGIQVVAAVGDGEMGIKAVVEQKPEQINLLNKNKNC